MHLKDLISQIENQSDEELLERLRVTRHNRSVARPVAKRKAAKAAKRESQAKTTSLEKLMKNLSAEEIQILLNKLET